MEKEWYEEYGAQLRSHAEHVDQKTRKQVSAEYEVSWSEWMLGDLHLDEEEQGKEDWS